jgi:hypothetical protein
VLSFVDVSVPNVITDDVGDVLFQTVVAVPLASVEERSIKSF